MPRASTIQKEILRRQKIGKAVREGYKLGVRKHWLKGKKAPTWYRKILSDYWKTHDKEGRFYKGMRTWNKGMKGYLAGEKHYNWKGGITKENNKIHGSAEWKNWRKAVFQRDNYTCQVCLRRGVYLEAHHKKLSSKFPKLRFVVSNGITLCRECHKKLKKSR